MSEVTLDDIDNLAKALPSHLEPPLLWCGKCGCSLPLGAQFWWQGIPYCSEGHMQAGQKIWERRIEEIERKRDRR